MFNKKIITLTLTLIASLTLTVSGFCQNVNMNLMVTPWDIQKSEHPSKAYRVEYKDLCWVTFDASNHELNIQPIGSSIIALKVPLKNIEKKEDGTTYYHSEIILIKGIPHAIIVTTILDKTGNLYLQAFGLWEKFTLKQVDLYQSGFQEFLFRENEKFILDTVNGPLKDNLDEETKIKFFKTLKELKEINNIK